MVFYNKEYGVCEKCGSSCQLVAWDSCSSYWCGRLCRACATKEAAKDQKLNIKLIGWFIRLCPGIIVALLIAGKGMSTSIAGGIGIALAILSFILVSLVRRKSVFLSWLVVVALNAAAIGLFMLLAR